MTSLNGNIFCVTGHLCGEVTGHRWITRTKASDAEFLIFSLIGAWIHGWLNNREAGDLGRCRAHYDVNVMMYMVIGMYVRYTSMNWDIIDLDMTSLKWNSPVTGEFPSQRPVTWSIDVFFDLRLNKRLSKQSRHRLLETPSHSLWRHSNVIIQSDFLSFMLRIVWVDCNREFI